MAKTIQQLLHRKTLLGIIKGILPGLPDDLFPAQMMVSHKATKLDSGSYFRIEGTRQTARMVAMDAPSRARQMSGVEEIPVKLLHTKEHHMIDPETVIQLHSMDSIDQDMGMQEVTRQTAELKQLFTNLRVASIFSTLADARISWDANKELLPDTTGAKHTIDFGVEASNRNQLDIEGAGDIIDASWADPATPIISQLKQIRAAVRRKSGYRLKHAFYGENLIDYILNNTQAKEIMNRKPEFRDQIHEGIIPNGFGALNWWTMDEAFFVDGSDATKTFFTGDQLTIIPEITIDFWDLLEGSAPVPRSLGTVGIDGVAQMGQIMFQRGMFTYALNTADPALIKQVAGDTFLPIVKVPGAMVIGDVTP